MIAVFIATSLFCSVFSRCRQPLIPPEAGEGEPFQFPVSKDPYPWIDRTNPKERRFVWFKIGSNGWYVDWDAERKPFDLIVVHHTAGKPDATAEEIGEIHRQRLYLPRYRSKDPDPYAKGLDPHSGHTMGGKETFIAYHHLIYPDGRGTTELQPIISVNGIWHVGMVGWHCGDWPANCRSIAICLVGDYSKKSPTNKQTEQLGKLARYYRQFNKRLTVEPHHQFNPNTSCPGKWWQEWREE